MILFIYYYYYHYYSVFAVILCFEVKSQFEQLSWLGLRKVYWRGEDFRKAFLYMLGRVLSLHRTFPVFQKFDISERSVLHAE